MVSAQLNCWWASGCDWQCQCFLLYANQKYLILQRWSRGIIINKGKQKCNFDTHHSTLDLTPLSPRDQVWVMDCGWDATVVLWLSRHLAYMRFRLLTEHTDVIVVLWSFFHTLPYLLMRVKLRVSPCWDWWKGMTPVSWTMNKPSYGGVDKPQNLPIGMIHRDYPKRGDVATLLFTLNYYCACILTVYLCMHTYHILVEYHVLGWSWW